jgi:hypothetical protein
MIKTLGNSHSYLLKPSWRPVLPITFLAVNRSGAIRFKRDLSFLSAICTGYRMHFSRRTVISSPFLSIHFYTTYFLTKFPFENSLAYATRRYYLRLWVRFYSTPVNPMNLFIISLYHYLNKLKVSLPRIR